MESKFVESFEEFKNNEADTYDEPIEDVDSSIRSEDHQTKDKINNILVVAHEIYNHLEDGQQLEPEQLKAIANMQLEINKLKRQLEDREEVRQKEEEEAYNEKSES